MLPHAFCQHDRVDHTELEVLFVLSIPQEKYKFDQFDMTLEQLLR